MRLAALYLLLWACLTGCCDPQKMSVPFACTILHKGQMGVSRQKDKMSVVFADDVNHKQDFSVSLYFDGKDSLMVLYLVPPTHQSPVSYLITNQETNLTDTLRLVTSVEKCSINVDQSLLNGREGKFSTLGSIMTFDTK